MAWGMRMALLDNVLRLVEPILVLACACLYAGGPWGSFKLAETTAYLLYRLSLLGLDRGIVWWYGQMDQAHRYRRDLFASLATILAASLVGSAAMIGLSAVAGGGVRGLSLSFTEVLLIAGSIPLLAISEALFQANLNQKNMIARILGKNIVLPLVTFGGAMAAHILHGPGLPVWFLLGCAANAAVAVVSFHALHGFSWSNLRPRLPDRALLSFSLPLMGSDLLSGLTTRMDLMLLGSLTDIRAVEIYNVVTMIGRSLQAIRESFESVLLSAFSGEGARKLTQSLRERLNHATWAVGNLMGLALLVVVFWGRDLLALMNPQYGHSYLPLVVMASFTYLNVFGDMSGLMLQGLGRTRSWSLARMIGFAANLLCNLWWIPLWGALGGVLALKVSDLAQGVASQILLRLESGSRIWMGAYLRNYAGFAAALVLLCGMSSFSTPLQLRIPIFVLVATAWLAIYRNCSSQFVLRFA